MNATRSRIASDIGHLRKSLRTLDKALRRISPVLLAVMPVNGAGKRNGRSRPRLSAKARASLVLQGRYMGYMRQLKPRQKAQVRKVRDADGVRAAINRAMHLARG